MVARDDRIQLPLLVLGSVTPPQIEAAVENDIQIGVIDVSSDIVETPEDVAEVIAAARRSSGRP